MNTKGERCKHTRDLRLLLGTSLIINKTECAGVLRCIRAYRHGYHISLLSRNNQVKACRMLISTFKGEKKHRRSKFCRCVYWTTSFIRNGQVCLLSNNTKHTTSSSAWLTSEKGRIKTSYIWCTPGAVETLLGTIDSTLPSHSDWQMCYWIERRPPFLP